MTPTERHGVVWVCRCDECGAESWVKALPAEHHPHSPKTMTPYVPKAKLDEAVQALSWAVEWIERIAEQPLEGHDPEEDCRAFGKARNLTPDTEE